MKRLGVINCTRTFSPIRQVQKSTVRAYNTSVSVNEFFTTVPLRASWAEMTIGLVAWAILISIAAFAIATCFWTISTYRKGVVVNIFVNPTKMFQIVATMKTFR